MPKISALNMKVILLAAALTLSGSLSGCSLLLKRFINPEVKEVPVEAPTDLAARVLDQERAGQILFVDNRENRFPARLKSAFQFDGKPYVVVVTDVGTVANQAMVLSVQEPFPGGVRFAIVDNKKEFQAVTEFLAKHRSLLKGNLKRSGSPPPAKSSFDLTMDSLKLEDGWFNIIASGKYRGQPYKIKILIQDHMEPALKPDGSMNPLRPVYAQAVKFISLGKESDPFIADLTGAFQVLDGTEKMNAKTFFGCLPQMRKPFNVARDVTVLKLYMLEPDRGDAYCDCNFLVNAASRKLTIKMELDRFKVGLVRSLSQ